MLDLGKTHRLAEVGATDLPGDERPVRQLLSVTQARTRLSLGQTKFYELLRTGELRSVKIGARRLIPTEAIDEYIAGLQGEGSSALTAGGDAA